MKIKTYISQMKTILTIGLKFYKLKGLYKLTLIASSATFLTPFLEALKKYIFPNMENFAVFAVLLTLDVITGLVRHSGVYSCEAKNNLNKDHFFMKLFKKVFISIIWLSLINVFDIFVGTDSFITEYLDGFGVSTLIAWFAWSIASNLHIIAGGEFPPSWIMDRLKKGGFNVKNEKNE